MSDERSKSDLILTNGVKIETISAATSVAVSDERSL